MGYGEACLGVGQMPLPLEPTVEPCPTGYKKGVRNKKLTTLFFSGMTNWITLKSVSLRYGISPETVLEWIKDNLISGSCIGGTWLVDNDSLCHYLELHKTLDSQQQYLDEQLAKRREEIDLIIAHYDDSAFILNSLLALTPLFHYMVAELATLIPEEDKRDLFLSVVNGESLEEIALRRFTTYDKIVCEFTEIIKSLAKHRDFIKLYPEKPDTETIRLLETNLDEFALNFRIRSCLHVSGIYTVKDLLLYIKHGNGLKSLKKMRNFGTQSYYILLNSLREHGIIDKEGNSPLLKFV